MCSSPPNKDIQVDNEDDDDVGGENDGDDDGGENDGDDDDDDDDQHLTRKSRSWLSLFLA